MTCLMHSFADAWVVLLQAHKAELDRSTLASQQEVKALEEEKDSAIQARNAASQVGNISVSCLGVEMQLHKSIQQLVSWLICLTMPSHHAITVLNIQQGA